MNYGSKKNLTNLKDLKKEISATALKLTTMSETYTTGGCDCTEMGCHQKCKPTVIHVNTSYQDTSAYLDSLNREMKNSQFCSNCDQKKMKPTWKVCPECECKKFITTLHSECKNYTGMTKFCPDCGLLN